MEKVKKTDHGALVADGEVEGAAVSLHKRDTLPRVPDVVPLVDRLRSDYRLAIVRVVTQAATRSEYFSMLLKVLCCASVDDVGELGDLEVRRTRENLARVLQVLVEYLVLVRAHLDDHALVL